MYIALRDVSFSLLPVLVPQPALCLPIPRPIPYVPVCVGGKGQTTRPIQMIYYWALRNEEIIGSISPLCEDTATEAGSEELTN